MPSRRLLAVAAALAGSFTAGLLPAGAGGLSYQMNGNPLAVPPGGNVTLTAVTGCAGSEVRFTFDGGNAPIDFIQLDPDTGADDLWQAQVSIPGNATSGQHTLDAFCDAVTGSGFYNTVTITVFITGTTVGTVTSTTLATSTSTSRATTTTAPPAVVPSFTG